MMGNDSAQSSETCRMQEHYSTQYAVVGTLFQSTIFVVGVLGNLLVCLVVCRSRSMHSTTNCYLVSVAVADVVTLMASVPQEVLSYHIVGDQWLWGQWGCTLIIYLQYLGIDASALSLTAFTVERYMAICHPMRSKWLCTISRAKKIIVGCWMFAILYCSPWFMLTTIRPVCIVGHGHIDTCTFRLSRDSTEYLILFFADLLLFYAVPLMMSVLLYCLIARVLLSPAPRKSRCVSSRSRVQVVRMLACVVLVFATLWVPYRGLLVFNSVATVNDNEPFLDQWYLMFAKTCVYVNCAINPILYNAMSDKFRRAFKDLLLCTSHPDTMNGLGRRSEVAGMSGGDFGHGNRHVSNLAFGPATTSGMATTDALRTNTSSTTANTLTTTTRITKTNALTTTTTTAITEMPTTCESRL